MKTPMLHLMGSGRHAGEAGAAARRGKALAGDFFERWLRLLASEAGDASAGAPGRAAPARGRKHGASPAPAGRHEARPDDARRRRHAAHAFGMPLAPATPAVAPEPRTPATRGQDTPQQAAAPVAGARHGHMRPRPAGGGAASTRPSPAAGVSAAASGGRDAQPIRQARADEAPVQEPSAFFATGREASGTARPTLREPPAPGDARPAAQARSASKAASLAVRPATGRPQPEMPAARLGVPTHAGAKALQAVHEDGGAAIAPPPRERAWSPAFVGGAFAPSPQGAQRVAGVHAEAPRPRQLEGSTPAARRTTDPSRPAREAFARHALHMSAAPQPPAERMEGAAGGPTADADGGGTTPWPVGGGHPAVTQAPSGQAHPAGGPQGAPGGAPVLPAARAWQGLVQAAVRGQDTLEMHLSPPHLGRVRARLEVDEARRVHVHLWAAHPEARQVLAAQLPLLRDALEAQGFALGSFAFADRGQERERPFAERRDTPPARGTPGPRAAATAATAPPAVREGRLSIHV